MGAKNVVLNNSWTKEQVSGEIKYWTECKWKHDISKVIIARGKIYLH